VAITVAYLLTGNITAAVGIGLIEPLVQTGVFALHERIWESVPRKSAPQLTPSSHHAIAG